MHYLYNNTKFFYGDNAMKKKVIIILSICLLIVSILLATGYVLIGNYFYGISLDPNTDKTFVIGSNEQTDEEKKEREEQLKWLDDNSEDVYINSTNNGILRLHGYEIKSAEESDIWTIVIHGYMSRGDAMTGYSQKFNERGYNVLMIDLRGHGLSEGDYIGMGWHDRLDVIDWINYILEKNPDSKIMLFGVSMGAATTMMTTGENLPDNVKLAIEDCGYTSAWDEFKYQLKQLFNLPEFPVLYAASNSCKRKANYTFKEASAVEQLKKSKTPTLFIHGSADDFVPFEMLDIVYNSANCEKEKLVVENAGHVMSSVVDSELYWNTIDSFINQYLYR